MEAKAADKVDRNQTRKTATFQAYYWEAYNEVVEPRRFDHYLIRKWGPELGSLGFFLIKVLRDRCYHNPATGILRDSCEIELEELGAAVGVSVSTLLREFKNNTALGQFVRRIPQYRIVDGKPQKGKNVYQVSMDDPIHPDDLERYDYLRAQKEKERDIPVPSAIIRAADGTTSYKGQIDDYRSAAPSKPPKGSKALNGQNDDYRPSYNGQNDDSIMLGQNDHTDTTCLPRQNDHTIENLPSGLLTKEDSLTPPAAESPHISPQGEGDALSLCWSHTLHILADRVNKPTFEAHIKLLRPVSMVEEGEQVTVMLAAVSLFSQGWVRDRHGETVREALAGALGRSVESVIVEIGRQGK
jgi:hypothetical protein